MILKDLIFCEYETEILGIKTDSRKVTKGDLFVCIKGQKFDNHDVVEEVIQNGAVAIISERTLDVSVPVIVVSDTRKALAQIASRFYNDPKDKIKLIGITGTDGKTTTATIIYQMLKDILNIGYIGTNGVFYKNKHDYYGYTTPEPLELHKIFHEFVQDNINNCVMEVSSQAIDQKRVFDLEYEISIFTNLSHEHLDYHKTMENYFAAKKKLFENTKGYAILNGDEEVIDKLKKVTKAKVLTYGINNKSDFWAQDIKLFANKTEFKLVTKEGTYKITSKLLGIYNVYNLLAAISTIYALGFNLNEIIPLISNIGTIEGRMERIELGQDFTVIVDFAHTPNALSNLLDFIQKIENKNRIIIVLGAAGERDKEKRPIMGEVVTNKADWVIFTSEDPKSERPEDIINQMISEVKDKNNFEIIIDRSEAIKKGIFMAEPNDVVLITGKGNENTQQIGDEKIAFNDIEEAKRWITEKMGKK